MLTSLSFSRSASLSAIRFLLSSSSFRASLVSVRRLSSFRILRIFLRPLRPSPSGSSSSSSSSPLCGNEHQVQLSDLTAQRGKKSLPLISSWGISWFICAPTPPTHSGGNVQTLQVWHESQNCTFAFYVCPKLITKSWWWNESMTKVCVWDTFSLLEEESWTLILRRFFFCCL